MTGMTVSRQVLANISLVTHSAALASLTCNSFTFYIFTINNIFYTPPPEEISRGVKSGK
jgi:hypothetical protein